MTDMIDRVAWALYANFAAEPNDKSFAALANTWRKPARAAIAAMREPSKEMLTAGDAHTDFVYSQEGDFLKGWRAAIDAALGEK